MISFFQKTKQIHLRYDLIKFWWNLKRNRRNNPKFIIEFNNTITSLWLLTFGVRIGSLLFLMLTSYGESEKAYAMHKIIIPVASNTEKIENKRLHSYLSVNSNGIIKFDRVEIHKNQLFEKLTKRRIAIPNVIITIISPNDCKMEIIQDVLEILKRAKTRRIFFLTKKEPNIRELY